MENTNNAQAGRRKMANIVNPFGDSAISDYKKLFSEFGVSDFRQMLPKLKNPPAIFRRGLVFGHRDFGIILDAIKNKKPFAIMTGIKPTNFLHIGSKAVIDQVIYFQKLGGFVYYCIADMEALADNEIPLEESEKIARDNIADLLALGLNPKKAKIYRQSEECNVQKYALLFSNNVTNSMMKAVYGEKELRIYVSAALIQYADILLPQIEKGRLPTLVPVGFDQEPHIRITRDIAKKYNFIPPASTYVQFLSSLTGEAKMSKRKPEGVIYLNENINSAVRKVKNAFSGGRNSLKEQKSKGGQPEICKIYELYNFGLIEEDRKLKDVFAKCKSGKLLCRECKENAYSLMKKFLEEHQKKRKKAEKIADKLF